MTKKQKFDLVGDAIVKTVSNVQEVFLDIFNDNEYIVVKFVGGAISVRNAAANSHTANIEEVSKMLNGGYYSEVEEYKDLKKKYFKEVNKSLKTPTIEEFFYNK